MRRIVLALLLASLATGIGAYPLLDPDEGRNAEVAREMAASNDYLLPRLNTLPYVDKPVLFFAAVAASIEVFGPREFAVRLPSLLFTLATIGVTWWFARRLAGPERAWIAAVATASAPLTIGFARTVIFDAALTCWVSVAVIAFFLASEEPDLARRQWLASLAWAAVALGVLTKGPIALALPLMVMAPYSAWRRSRALLDPVGILLFLALVLPWVRYMSTHVPDYLGYVIGTETVGRLTTPALQRTGPWWYFIPILLAGALPWSVAAFAGGATDAGDERARRVRVLLLTWILVPLVFFSLSQSKRPQYVLPLVVPFALLVATRWNRRTTWYGAGALAGLGLVVLVAYRWVPGMIRNLDAEVAEQIPRVALLLGGASLVAGVAAVALRARETWAVAVLAAPAMLLPLFSRPLMRAVGEDRSARMLADAISPVITDAAEVVGVGVFPLSLPFYLQREVALSTADARELTSNYLGRDIELWRDVPGSPLREAGWWREVVIECSRPRFFVIRTADDSARAFLSTRVPHLVESRKYAVYGPCGDKSLATEAVRRSGGQAVNTSVGPSPRPPVRLSD